MDKLIISTFVTMMNCGIYYYYHSYKQVVESDMRQLPFLSLCKLKNGFYWQGIYVKRLMTYGI